MRTLVILALAAFGAAPATFAQGPPYRIDGVHADINVSYTASGWQPRVMLDFPMPQFDNLTAIPADQAILRVKPNPFTTVAQPGSPNFNFIGAGAGNPFLRLGQTSLLPNQLFLGAETSGMSLTAPGSGWANWNPKTVPINPSANPGAPNVSTKLVELIITEVRAPANGQFSVWFASGGVPTVYASTFERGHLNAAGQNSLFVPINGHVHFNWGFTELGRYEIDLVARTFYHDDVGGLTELRSDPLNPFTFVFDASKERDLSPYLDPNFDYPIIAGPVVQSIASPVPVPFAPIPEPAVGLFVGVLLAFGCGKATRGPLGPA